MSGGSWFVVYTICIDCGGPDPEIYGPLPTKEAAERFGRTRWRSATCGETFVVEVNDPRGFHDGRLW